MDPLKTISSIDAKNKAFSLLEEFKAFAFKGNVIDLAVGVIIGAAFSKIVESLVKNLIMPLIGAITGGSDPAKGLEGLWAPTLNGSTIRFGAFMGDIVNFLIVAVALFIFIVKLIGWVMKSNKEAAVAAPPPPPTKDQELLMEIRDVLKQQKR
ncbi:MAG: large conductance mechanosensitive channel protein MscL [Gammaproteobacteria bacterium]